MAPAQQIQVACKTSVHESHCLFDFHASNPAPQSESYPVQGAGACMQAGGRVACMSLETPASQGSRPLLKFERQEERIQLTPAKDVSGAWKPWIVVQESQAGKAKIDVGDEILLGRASLTVAQVVTDQRSPEAPHVSNGLICESCDPSAAQDMQCRICLMDGSSKEDPFVQPCRCSGSVANVHLSCLRQWTKTRLNLSEAPVESFVYKTPSCEMCKAEYPALISTGKKTEPLVDSLPRVKAPYLVLRSSMRSAKSGSKDTQTSFHVVSFAKSSVAKVGRGEDAHVRLNVPTVSRWHATFKFQDGEITLEDHESKFGTLLAMHKPWTVVPEQTLSVKMGRSVFSFALPSENVPTEASSPMVCSEDSMDLPDLVAESSVEDDLEDAKPSMERTTTRDA